MRGWRGCGRTGGPGQPDDIACDLIAMTGGWTPSVHLFSQSRGKLKFDAATQHVPAGRAGAEHGLRRRLRRRVRSRARRSPTARAAGGRGRRGAAAPRAPTPSAAARSASSRRCRRRNSAKAFVDFQNDVTARDIKLATREGMRSIEHIKRYTTTGMATDQGKTSNMNALAIAAEALGREIAEVGLTTFRLPYTPVTFGIFGGPSKREMLDPIRETPIHSWYAAQGRGLGGGGPVEARLARAAGRREPRGDACSASA